MNVNTTQSEAEPGVQIIQNDDLTPYRKPVFSHFKAKNMLKE